MSKKDDGITCLFFGSGASYALANIPIQDKFLKTILNSEGSAWVNASNVKIGNDELLTEWMLREGDIEFCMSHIHNMGFSDRSNDYWKLYKKANINLRAAMVPVLVNWQRNKGTVKNFKKWWALKRFNESNVVILTTNYDLIIEKLLDEMNFDYFYPEIPSLKKRENGICLYKLHGSINRMEKRETMYRECVQNSCEPYDLKAGDGPLQIETEKSELWEKKSYFLEGNYRVFGDKDKSEIYTPIFVPFYFQKMEWLNGRWGTVFQPHWKSAEVSLSEKDVRIKRIYFLGYNLPPADHYILSWLIRIFEKRCAGKRNVHVVCNSSSPERLEVAIKPFLSKKSGIEERCYSQGLNDFLIKEMRKETASTKNF